MDRRTLLETAGAVGVVALAGCGGRDADGDTPSNSTDATTPTDTETRTVDAVTMQSDFTVLGSQSGQERDEASVSTAGSTVTVEGTIWGADGCTTAELDGVTYDAAADELTVAVATTERETTATAWTQTIVEIDYRSTVSFEGPLPGVVVTHDRGDGPVEVARASQ